MINAISEVPVGSLRQRMIDDMNMRRYARETQRNYVRDVARLATYLGRPPDTATAEDLRQFQIDQREAGLGVPTMNSIVAALRFFFTHTLDRPDLSRKLYTVKHPRSLPVVLSPDEVARLLVLTAGVNGHRRFHCVFRKIPDSDFTKSRTGISVNTGQ
ncbi:Phage integrase, N-terminal SAM-like domain [Sphingobium sp. AP50]|nr:Phage integrase, N-terminal SAM-like domain [Sphingobium sp. AP50]